MTRSEVFVKNMVTAGVTFIVSLAISVMIGKLLVTDRAYAALIPNVQGVSLFNCAQSLVRFAKSSSVQLILAAVTAFSIYAVPVSLCLMAYRGGSLGFALSVLLRGAYRTQTGEVAGMQIMWPVMLLYFISTIIILVMSAKLNSFYKAASAFTTSSRVIFNSVAVFLLCSGTVFALDIFRILFL